MSEGADFRLLGGKFTMESASGSAGGYRCAWRVRWPVAGSGADSVMGRMCGGMVWLW